MKKICLITMSILMICAFALVGCGSSEQKESEAETTAQQAAADGGYVFAYKGTVIPMDQEVSEILNALGKEKSYTEEKSCAFEGLDKSYYYGSFYLYTYPNGEKDYVSMVELVDDTVATEEGVAIGDSKEKVESVYGSDGYNGVNAYVMEKGNTTLTIIMENDKVKSIQYAAVLDNK